MTDRKAPLHGLTVLVVDDDDAGRYVTVRKLQKKGAEVVEAATGNQALDRIALKSPDAVVLDVHLPDMDGFEVCRRIRKTDEGALLPIIHLSALKRDDASRVTGLEAGADAYLVSPVDADVLAATILSVLRIYRAEREVELLAKSWEDTFAALQMGICITDESGRVLLVNQSFARLVDSEPRDCRGRRLEELLGESCGQSDWEHLTTTLSGDKSASARMELCDRWFDVRFDPMTGGEVSLTGRILSFADVTEQVKLEEQLRHAQRLEAIGRLAGGVAHDFNNILTPILGYAELMAAQLPEDHPHRRRLDVIRRAAERGKDLTRQLLAFGRKQTLKKEALSLNEVVADFEKMLSRTIPESVTIKLELDSQDPIVLADRAQLEQVIMNLAVNGADAMPQGGTLTIGTERKQIHGGEIGALEGMAAGEFAVLSVSDTGTGIDEDVLEHIFEPFFTTKEKGRGTGLGLSTVFGIVRQHGGDVRVYSEKGKGSTFRVYLPMVEGAWIKREQDAGNRLVDSGDLAGTESILVVEDQGEVRDLAVTVLEEAGYRVRAAESGEQALELLETDGSQLDLVLTDVVMTGMSGPDMVVRLREKFPDVRVIYMSGYPRSVLADQDLVSDGADVLSKPFMPSELLVRVRSVLDGETE